MLNATDLGAKAKENTDKGMTQTRLLGKLEKKFTKSKACNVVVPTLLSLKRDIDQDLLRQAVKHYIRHQPNLNAGIVKEGCELRFKPLSTLEDYFEVLSPDTYWKDVCLKYSNFPLRTDLENFPAFKVFFLPHAKIYAYFIVVYVHHVADGTNGMTMVHDILHNYCTLRLGKVLDEIHFDAPPSVDDMAKSAFVGNEMEDLNEKYVNYMVESYDKLNCCIPFEESEVPATQALYYTSTPNVYEEFIKTCRVHKVTVGCALMAASYFAHAGYIFESISDCPLELFIGVTVPINMRQRVLSDVSWHCCNCSVTQFVLVMGLKKENCFWKFAQEIHHLLERNFDKKFHLFDTNCTDEITNSAPKKQLFEKFGISQQMCVSNMKKYPSSVLYEEFTVESIHCVGGLWLTDFDVMELMIYSSNKFNLSMIHREGQKNIERADHVFKYIKYIVENAADLTKEFKLSDCMETYRTASSAIEK